MTTPDVVQNTSRHRFEIHEDGSTAELVYNLEDKTITFTHTGVPSQLEGRGIGSALAKAGLEYAREHSLKVVAQCPFIATWLQRHPEYQSLTS
jgi:uncharacterized protein